MEIKKIEKKIHVGFLIHPKTKDKLKKMSKFVDVPMGVIVDQLIQQQWQEGGYDEAEVRSGGDDEQR